MKKVVLPYDMECMKVAMLKHEETFKQQVYELHRLYQTQRMLMKNMQRSMHQETWSLKNDTIGFDHQNGYPFNKPQKEDPVDENGSFEFEDETELELTLGLTSYTRRRNKPTFNTKLTSDSKASFSSSTGSSHKYGENSRVLSVEEQMRHVDRSLKKPSWLRHVLI